MSIYIMSKYYINYGGSYGLTPNIFYLYTTGIVNWGNFGNIDQNLIILWNNQIRDIILSKIPDNFQINIVHFDPLLDIDKVNTENIKLQQIEYVNENLIPSDLANDRIIESEFRREGIDINDISNPHLVLDFAHVFNFIPLVNNVTIDGYYGEEPSELLNLNVLRTGFIGNGFGKSFTLSDTIRIEQSGQVKTYIDKMIELGIDYDTKNPELFFEDILKKIILGFENIIKELKGNVPLFKIEHILQRVKPPITDILNSIMARFWNDMSRDRIIEEVIDYYIRINFDTIDSMEIK